MPSIKIQLSNQDATTLNSDLVLFGHKNNLKKSLEYHQGKQFEKIIHETEFSLRMVSFEMLNLENHNWKRAVAINYTSRKNIYNRLLLSINDVLSHQLHYYRPNNIIILPFSWRYPENIAFCTLYSLWEIGYVFFTYSSKFPFLLKADPTSSLIRIVDLVSTDVYREYLNNDCEKLWFFIDKQIDKAIKRDPWLEDNWKKIRKNKFIIQFQVIE
jgi:hypothetical protein